jgi:hypothetical protein
MKHFISHWELQPDTQNTWASVNCTNGRAEIIKHMGCWMLEIRFDSGKSHVSSHNTRDEAMRQAEYQAVWTVEFA